MMVVWDETQNEMDVYPHTYTQIYIYIYIHTSVYSLSQHLKGECNVLKSLVRHIPLLLAADILVGVKGH